MRPFNKFHIIGLALLFIMTAICAAPAMAQDEQPGKVTFALTGAFVTSDDTGIYQEIVDYIAKQAGFEADLLSGLSYTTVNGLVKSGTVGVGFVCGYPYIMTHDASTPPQINLLVAPIMKNDRYGDKPVYYANIIVHKDSQDTSLEELRGKRFAYNDKISTTGYIVPRAYMVEAGMTDGYFGEVIHSGSHEESIRMIATGEADAASVSSLIYDYALATNFPHIDDVRIVQRIGPIPISPIVYSAQMDMAMAEKIRDAFLHMHEDPQGRDILDRALINHYTTVADEDYDDLRKRNTLAIERDFLEIR